MANETPPPKVRIRFEKGPGYRVLPCGGVWGSLTPQGYVFASFHHDHVDNPPEVILDQATGEQVVEAPSDGSVQVTRVTECALLLRPEIARSIGRWLIRQADEADTTPKRLDNGKKRRQ